MRSIFSFVFLLLLLNGCNNDEKKFPGFEEVVVPGQETVYLYEVSSVDKRSSAYHEGRYSAFRMIKKLKDGYIIQFVTTDCATHISTKDGYFYAYKGGARKEYPRSVKPIEIGDDTHLRMLIKATCFKKQETNLDKVLADKNSVLIIPHKEKVSGFITKDSKAYSQLSADDRSTDFVIKKGAEVLVTGVSNDGNWVELEYQAHKKLYVPSSGVAIFSD